VVAFIGNGALADELQYPWHVGIFDKNFVPEGSATNKSIIEHICGGTLITPQVVVSGKTSVKLTEPKQPAHIKPILNDCATFVLVCALLFDDCA